MDRNNLDRIGRNFCNKIKNFLKQNPFLFLIISAYILVELYLIKTRGPSFSLNSDDAMYLMSAETLIKKGVLSCQSMGLPTAFITPGMTLLLTPLALVFGTITSGPGIIASKLYMVAFGSGILLLTYLLAVKFFNKKITGLIAALSLALYIPFLQTSALTLTEIPFIFFLLLFIYQFLIFADKDSYKNLSILVGIYFVALMIRPTIALVPVFLLPLYLTKKTDLKDLFKKGIFGASLLVLLLTPWWVRNYTVFDQFIPLSTGSSNPLFVGTYDTPNKTTGQKEYARYRKDRIEIIANNVPKELKEEAQKIQVEDPEIIGYEAYHKKLDTKLDALKWGYLAMTPQDTVKFEKAEEAAGKERVRKLLKENPKEFVSFYMIRKPTYLWGRPFYWLEIFDIKYNTVFYIHRALLYLFPISILLAIIKNWRAGLSVVLLFVYFTALYAYYFSFDRYNLTLMPLVIIVDAFGFVMLFKILNYVFRSFDPGVFKRLIRE